MGNGLGVRRRGDYPEDELPPGDKPSKDDTPES